MDAFTHCLEAYLSNGFHPLADAVAIDGIARVARSLPTAVHTGSSVSARLEMMIAAMEGAMAFQKGLGNAHALAHALTPRSGLHHGLANAVVLPSVMEFNRGVSTARLARVAVAMGEPSGARDDVLAAKAIDRVRALTREVGLPTRLAEAGVKEADLDGIADLAFRDASHQGNPRPTTRADLLAIARNAY
jgi:alcohol dehydrogenase class IV